MKKLFQPFLLSVLLFVFPTISFPDTASDLFYVGAAKSEITPAIGTPLAGFGKRHGKPSVGVHDPLFARAIALRKTNQQFVFISTDLVLIDEKLRKEVLRKIRLAHPLQDNQLVLFATHTHSGSGAIGGRFWSRFIMGKFKKNVFDYVTDKITEAASSAIENQKEAVAEYGQSDISELVENRMDEKLDHVPDTLKILRFATQGQTIATMVFMAVHPTLLPASNLYFSADFPGELTQFMEQEQPGAVSLFVNGAAADLRPHAGEFDNRFDKSKAYAASLHSKIKMISFSPINVSGIWEGLIERKRLPQTKIRVGWLRIPSVFGNRFFPRKTNFQMIRLGQVLFYTFPGELGSEIAGEIESRASERGFIPFTVGYANDYIAYVISRYHYLNHDYYESSVSFYGKKMDWFFQKLTEDMMSKLLTPGEKSEIEKPGILSSKDLIPVLKLSGTPYHQGYEEGRLLKNQIQKATDGLFRYFRSEIPIPILNRVIINTISSRAWKKMEPYITYNEYLEMKGIADGSGVSFGKIKKIHAVPELYPTLCANSAFWGPATEDGRLIAIRNLDWNRKIGIHHYAAIKFHRYRSKQSYVNIGYYGFNGVLSGINQKGISIGQIGASSIDESMKGVPMPFLMKRILQESGNLEDAKSIFERSHLTRGYNYVIADANAKQALVVEATQNHIAFLKDNDPAESSVGYALSLSNAVFRGDPAIDPTIRNLQTASHGDPKKTGLETPEGSAYEIRYKKHGELIAKNFGKINPETAKIIAAEIAPGSNIQSVIYAFPDFWVSNMRTDQPAAKSQYTRFNFEEFENAA